MLFSVGDKIAFKKDTIKGEIISIESPYRVTVLCTDGFEMIVSTNELVKIEDSIGTQNIYNNNLYDKDYLSKDSTSELVVSKKNMRSNTMLKVDLHLEKLNLIDCQLESSEILQIQLKKCFESIEKALNSNVIKLEIIHGIGKGILKKEIHSILENYNLKFYLTKDGGATEVYF